MSPGDAAARMGGQPFAAALDASCAEFGIVDPLHQAHFLAQLACESAGFRRTVESMNYSVHGLLRTFGRHRISAADCRRLGRRPRHPAQQREIANTVYGGEWGRIHLGNTQPNDGWHFRGHGLAQTTGRYNTNRVSIALFGDQRATVTPDLLRQPIHAARTAGWEWKTRGCAGPAGRDDIHAVTRLWNGGQNGLSERIRYLRTAKQLLGVQ